MPTLKQLTCHVEWAPTNIPFKEYGVSYSDGVVESYIAIPPEPTPFSINLRSYGYIAPGLAMFVFMDGVYQCNRNKDNLTASGNSTGTNKEKDASEKGARNGVDFRVRQKEEARPDKNWIGRPWRFEPLQIIPEVPGMPDIGPKSHFDHLGEIVVIVLRCAPRSGCTATISDGSRTPDSAMAPSLNPNDLEAAISDEEFELAKTRYKQLEVEAKQSAAAKPEHIHEPEKMLGAFDMLFDGASDKYDQVRKLHHAYHNCKSFLRKMRREQDSDHCTECDDADQEPKLKELTRHRTRPRSGSYIRMRRPQPAEQSDSKDDCSTCAENNPSTGRYRGRRRSRHDHPHDRQSIRLPFRENRERAARFSFDSDYHGHRGRAASRSKDRHSHTRHELRGRRRSPALETAPRECDCPECSQSKSHRQSAERSQPCQKHHHQHHGKSNSLELDIEAYRHSHENPGCLKPIARPSRNQKERRASDCSCSECAKLARHTTRHSQKSCDFGDQETCTDHRYALGNQKEIHSVRSRRGESPKLRNSYGAVAQGAHQGAPSIILNVNQPSCKGEHPACKACNNHSNGCYVISNGERVPHNCRRPQTHAPDTEHTSRGASVHGHSQNGCRNFSGHSHHHHSDRSDRQPSGSFHCCSHAGDVTHNCGSEHRCNASGSNAGNCGNDTHHTQQATNESEWNKPVSHQSFTGGTGDKKSQGDWDQTKAEPQSWNVNDNSGSGNGGQGDWPPNDAAGDPGGVQGDSSWNHNGNPSWDNNNGSNQADPDWNGGNNPSWGTNNGGNQADSGWENGNNNAPNNSSWDSGNGDNQQSTSWDNNGNNGGDWQNENGNNQNNDQQDNWANSSNNNNNSNDNSWEIAKDASLNQDQLPQENQHEISNTGENNADVNSNNRKSTSSAAEVSQQPTRQIHWILPQPYRFAMPTQQPVLPPLVYHDPQNDEPPLYTVPEAVAQAESLSHQVQVGRAENYIHKLRVPHYLDTMEEPYAKFVFRYRVQDIIEKKFNVKVERDPEVERRKLELLPKAHIVDQLLQAQGFLGKQPFSIQVGPDNPEQLKPVLQYGGTFLNTENEVLGPSHVLPHQAILSPNLPASTADLPGLIHSNIDGASGKVNKVSFPHGFYVYHSPYYCYSSEPIEVTGPKKGTSNSGPHHVRRGSKQSVTSRNNSGAQSSRSRNSAQNTNRPPKPNNLEDNGDQFQNRQSSESTNGGGQARAVHWKDPPHNRKPSGASTNSGDPFLNNHRDSQNGNFKTGGVGDSGDPSRNTGGGTGRNNGDPFQAQNKHSHRSSTTQGHSNNSSGKQTWGCNGGRGPQTGQDWRQETVTDAVQW